MRLVSIRQMVELEKQANAAGLSYDAMMANAGRGLADVVHARFGQDSPQTVTGLVGSGNNGGDTLVALKHLSQWGWKTQAYLVKERKLQDALLREFQEAGGSWAALRDDGDFSVLREWVQNTDVLLDGILGTGIRLPLKDEVLSVLSLLDQCTHHAKVVAVDCPSGVDCDSGEASDFCLPADLTVCMAAVKQGLLKFPAFKFVGEIATVDIQLPHELPGWANVRGEVMGQEEALALLPERPLDGHKGTYGTCLVIAGSVQYCGAVLLACEAAYRAGSGLVMAAVPASIYPVIAGHLPEAIWLLLPDENGVMGQIAYSHIKDHLARKTTILLGPGWGTSEATGEFLAGLLDLARIGTKNSDRSKVVGEKGAWVSNFPPMVVDADALKLMANIPNWHQKVPAGSVLTPHPGEMAILTGKSIDEIQAERIESALHFARHWGHTVVLKGACSVVANSSGDYTVIPLASSALATAGTGDVLAGIITAFIGQGMEGYDAACTAAWLHARAGILAADDLGSERCVLARDVINRIGDALKKNTGQR